MANKLNPELVQNIAELTNVKKISDLPIIDVIEKDNETETIRTTQQFNNSYLLSSTLLEDNSQVGGRYFNYRVKLNEVTEYLSTLSEANMSVFRKTFDFFIDSLKNNTKDSYVQFIPANDTIDTENDVMNYSYTFKYNLSEVHDEVIGFTYNITSDGIEEISTYSYTNVLTEGLVTNVTLEKYVRNSIATILGVPSTPAALSEAIDSVIEFVDWFKGYSKNKDGLAELIRKFTEKDSEIISSYIEADSALSSRIDLTNSRIDNLDTTKNADAGKYITGIQQIDGLITNITSKQIETSDISGLNEALNNSQVSSGRFIRKEIIDNKTYLSTYIDVDPTAHFDSGGVRYSLTFNDQGQIGFNSIPELTFSASGGGPYEYLSTTPTIGQITYTVNKASTVVRLDSATGTETIIQSGHTINLSNTNDNSHTLYAQPLDGYSDKTANISFKFNKFKYWAFVDSQDNLTASDVKGKDIKGTIVNGYPTSRIDFTISSNESKYIYLLIKKKTSGSFTFKIGQDKTPGQNAGGMTQIGNDINDIYDNSIYYQLWRSTTVKTGDCNIVIS